MSCREAGARVCRRARRLLTVLLIALPAPGIAASGAVQISHLNDVAFGQIANLFVDQAQSQTVCAYSTVLLGQYSITAIGSGNAGAFMLVGAGNSLPYEVQWSSGSGQASGTALSPGAALTGQTSSATLPDCPLGLTSSGSLIVLLRSAALTNAIAGNYSGTLTLILAPN